MSEDTPVNTGVVEWPNPDSAYFTVRKMQIKLHQWAGEDASRRFGAYNGVVFTGASSVAVLPLPRQHHHDPVDPETGNPSG